VKPNRKLALKRELLADLSTDELRAVAGAGVTMLSCATYISCNPLACVIETIVC
jgi:hypothetical protein